MTTLFAIATTSDLADRCSPRCSQASQPRCRCLCGGHNHGKRRVQASEQTRQNRAMAPVSSPVHDPCHQPTLWEAL